MKQYEEYDIFGLPAPKKLYRAFARTCSYCVSHRFNTMEESMDVINSIIKTGIGCESIVRSASVFVYDENFGYEIECPVRIK